MPHTSKNRYKLRPSKKSIAKAAAGNTIDADDQWWLSHLESWQQDNNQQMLALDKLRDDTSSRGLTEDTELLLKRHNLIHSVSLAHLEQLTFD